MPVFCLHLVLIIPDVNSNNIILIIKDRRLYFPGVTLSAKYNESYQSLLAKDFEGSVC